MDLEDDIANLWLSILDKWDSLLLTGCDFWYFEISFSYNESIKVSNIKARIINILCTVWSTIIIDKGGILFCNFANFESFFMQLLYFKLASISISSNAFSNISKTLLLSYSTTLQTKLSHMSAIYTYMKFIWDCFMGLSLIWDGHMGFSPSYGIFFIIREFQISIRLSIGFSYGNIHHMVFSYGNLYHMGFSYGNIYHIGFSYGLLWQIYEILFSYGK